QLLQVFVNRGLVIAEVPHQIDVTVKLDQGHSRSQLIENRGQHRADAPHVGPAWGRPRDSTERADWSPVGPKPSSPIAGLEQQPWRTYTQNHTGCFSGGADAC